MQMRHPRESNGEAKEAALRLLWPSWPSWNDDGTEATEKKSFAFAKGAGSTFWVNGDVLGEYPYQCRCDEETQLKWLQGSILNAKEDWSPVPCEGQASSALIESNPKCDPSNQRPRSWVEPSTR